LCSCVLFRVLSQPAVIFNLPAAPFRPATMKVLVVLAACAAIVAARPEPPVGGYNYHHGGHHGGGGHGGHGGHSGYNYAQPQQFLGGSVGQFSGGAASAAVSTGASAFDAVSGFGAAGSFSGGSSQASFGAPQQQIVQKHIYVHVPPQESEQTFQQQIVAPGLRQKHYKIIFIKTPSVQPSAAQLALQQSLTEEKTIVYVLVKKPDSLDNINLPVPPVSKPSKPEVYFIKYKTNSEQVPLQGISTSSSGSSSAQADAGLGLLSSSGGASASSTATAGSFATSGVANVPAQQYGAPHGHHHGHGYH
uniref:DUF243 domain-containing protein n=2 Tax=Anopheles atroparvus TaxID=41427 RepID=A0A182JAM8_ANOAO